MQRPSRIKSSPRYSAPTRSRPDRDARRSCRRTAIHSWPAFTAIRPASRSTKLEQNSVAAAGIAPFDVAAGLANDPAGAALHTTVNRDLYLTLVVEFVASRRAGLEQRKQRRRRRRMRADLDVGAAGVHQIAVVEQLVLDTHCELSRHVRSPSLGPHPESATPVTAMPGRSDMHRRTGPS